MFWRRKRYQLPKVPPTVAETFHRLCEPLPEEQLEEVREQLARGVDYLYELSRENPGLTPKTIEALKACSLLLLERYPDLSPERRALVIGAIRYFIATDDPVSDAVFASGLRDDVQVMNYVLQQVGVNGHFIDEF